MGTVQPLKLSDASFVRRIRDIAKDSEHVVITSHAKARMKKRRISLPQVLACLRKGHVVEPAHISIHGDWKATLEHVCAGDLVRVAVAIEKQSDGDFGVVVTVME